MCRGGDGQEQAHSEEVARQAQSSGAEGVAAAVAAALAAAAADSSVGDACEDGGVLTDLSA